MKSTILCAVVGATIMCCAAAAFAQASQPAHSPPPCTTPSECIVAGAAPLKSEAAAPSNDVPEPGTLALMGIGAIGVGYISRRYGARKA